MLSHVPCAWHVAHTVHTQDPVITPAGCLFSREAILDNLLAQKKAIKKNMAAWEGYERAQQQKVCARVGTKP